MEDAQLHRLLHNRCRPLFSCLIVGLVTLGACASEPHPQTMELDFLATRPSVFQPQFAVSTEGELFVAWREHGGDGSDLYLARGLAGGTFSSAVRVNDIPGSVESFDLDEGRAALAVGPGNRIAMAWGTEGGEIFAAISTTSGRTFNSSIKLNQDSTKAYRGFPTIAFDAAGVLHAAWIDSRFAGGAEEPADLYYATVHDGAAAEKNLTAAQEASICGCCRLQIEVDDSGELTIVFRNTTEDGYRDIFRVRGSTSGHFGDPERIGPAMWKLNACPMAGPVLAGPVTLWNEASTGKRRLLSAAGPGDEFGIVLEDSENWSIQRPPRLVVGVEAGSPMYLVPGRPTGRLIRPEGATWKTVVDDLPQWSTSAAISGDRLLLLGSESGSARFEVRQLGS